MLIRPKIGLQRLALNPISTVCVCHHFITPSSPSIACHASVSRGLRIVGHSGRHDFFREQDQLCSKMPVISIKRPMVIILLSHHTSFRKMQHLELSFMLLYIVLAPIKHDASAVCSTMRGLSFKFGQHIKQIQSIVQLISSLTATGIIMNTSSLIPVCSINKYRSCIFKGQPSDSNHYIFPSHLPLCPCPPS